MSLFILYLGLLLFLCKRLLTYLRYLQQENYDAKRFLKWVWKHHVFDKGGSVAVLLGFFISYGLGGVTLAFLAWREENPCKTGKIPLQLTARAKRLYCAAVALIALVGVPLLFFLGVLGALALIQLMPLWLVLAAHAIAPEEYRRQKKYLQKAKERLAKANPLVIGITGSYGKTSTKHYLGQLLTVALGKTFWPKEGINTAMGIARAINEELTLRDEYAVIEMGAYGIGSIASLCTLAQPQAAILTAIGVAHLERFGSQETIAKAKGELIAALPSASILVVNGDDPRLRTLAEKHSDLAVFYYGREEGARLDARILSYGISLLGTHFKLMWRGEEFSGFLPQHGPLALMNAVAAFTMASALGGDPLLLISAMHHLKGVSQRLQVDRHDGILFLRDGYNSNLEGMLNAVEVLQALPARRRVAMTPGIIELGPLQQEYNMKAGSALARCCDLALIVGETNRATLISGLQLGGMQESSILTFKHRDAALAALHKLLKSDDAVLIANDLGDLYEKHPTL